MAGVVSPSMPVFILENEQYGNKAYCTMNEGLGKVLRYGAFSDDVIKRLKWMETVLYPSLKVAISTIGRIDLKNIIAQALQMGDEVHNRNRAATSLLYRTLAPAIVQTHEEGLVRALDDEDLGRSVVAPGEADSLVAGGAAFAGNLQALGLCLGEQLLVLFWAEPVKGHWRTSVHRSPSHFDGSKSGAAAVADGVIACVRGVLRSGHRVG